MSFPVFSRPGKLVHKTRDYGKRSHTLHTFYIDKWKSNVRQTYNTESIRAARYGNLDLWRYTTEITPLYMSNYADLPFGGTGLARFHGDATISPKLAFLGIPFFSRRVPGALYSGTVNDFDSSYKEALLASYGATGIARAWPTNPTADMAVFLGELREGLPSYVGHSLKKKGLRGTAGEWLNVNFAIKPLISDLQSFKKAWDTGPQRLAKLREQSGKEVRRVRTVVEEEKVETSSSSVSWEALLPGTNVYHTRGLPTLPPLITTTTQRENVWVSGKFYFHIPKRDVSPVLNDMLDSLQYNWGILPDPSTAWELTPFSWAVDYFANVGDVIRNLSRLSQGNQFTDAYVMRHSSVTLDQELPGLGLRTSQKLERKIRRRVSPFALAPSMDLSPMQWANLLAVGWERHLSR